MNVAKNKNNKRVYIDDVLNNDYKNMKFYCQICGEELIVRNGSIKTPHFAHKSLQDCDTFSSDMSEWHKSWQEKFPEENREVVIEYNDEKHRADVCINGYVIEFQHSPISREEFNKRNNFYTNAGYKLVWIFDYIGMMNPFISPVNSSLKDYLKSGNTLQQPITLYFNEITQRIEYIYKNASKFFKDFIPQKEKNIKILFQFFDSLDDDSLPLALVTHSIIENNFSDFSKFMAEYYFSVEDFLNKIKNKKFNHFIISDITKNPLIKNQELIIIKREKRGLY